ncbi:MAG: hypothetical protein LAO51_01575 [Acidobacteriia bacterium]|nr:hypothetical protein [Terriglobia bacterium]
MNTTKPLQECRQDAPAKSDREAMVEYQRFSRWEVEHGAAAGWRFEVGWFGGGLGVRWAWFSREVNDG